MKLLGLSHIILLPFFLLFSSHSSAFFLFPGEGQSRPGPWEVLVMKCSQIVLKGMWHLPQISFLPYFEKSTKPEF